MAKTAEIPTTTTVTAASATAAGVSRDEEGDGRWIHLLSIPGMGSVDESTSEVVVLWWLRRGGTRHLEYRFGKMPRRRMISEHGENDIESKIVGIAENNYSRRSSASASRGIL